MGGGGGRWGGGLRGVGGRTDGGGWVGVEGWAEGSRRGGWGPEGGRATDTNKQDEVMSRPLRGARAVQ